MQFMETRRQEGEAVAVRGLILQCSDLRRPGQGSELDWRPLTASSSSDGSGAWLPGRLPRADGRRWFPGGALSRACPQRPTPLGGSSLGRVSAAAPVLPPPDGQPSSPCRGTAERSPGSFHTHTFVFHLGNLGPEGAKAGAGKTQGGRPSPLSSEGTSGRAWEAGRPAGPARW